MQERQAPTLAPASSPPTAAAPVPPRRRRRWLRRLLWTLALCLITLSSLLGLGSVGDTLLNMGGQLLTLKFSREDESEADLVGLELAARAGYRPEAGVSLWQKMGEASKGAPPQWLSTHPAGPSRIKEIEANLPKVDALYARAEKPPKRFEVAPPLKKS